MKLKTAIPKAEMYLKRAKGCLIKEITVISTVKIIGLET